MNIGDRYSARNRLPKTIVRHDRRFSAQSEGASISIDLADDKAAPSWRLVARIEPMPRLDA
ncbi:MAG: hypothetical protein C3F11_15390 [Methylocystaceae bacterium]|nr:MAG: hypothetical protein C3F11_15390 [Methylocystaceae bacterium]